MLRGACVFIVSERGRVEAWSTRQAFQTLVPSGRKLTLHTKRAARDGRRKG